MAHEPRRFTLVFSGTTTDADELRQHAMACYLGIQPESAEIILDSNGFNPQREDLHIAALQTPGVIPGTE